MQTVRKLACYSQRNRVADACRIAHFDHSGSSTVGNCNGEACRPAHQNARRKAIDQHRGSSETVRTKLRAMELDLAVRHCRGRGDVVDSGFENSLRAGFVRISRHRWNADKWI